MFILSEFHYAYPFHLCENVGKIFPIWNFDLCEVNLERFITSLIKFVEEKKHAQEFIDGNLFCMPWHYYRGLENNQRGDFDETAYLKKIYDVNILNQSFSYTIYFQNIDDIYSPVFCMYSVFSEKNKPTTHIKLINEKLREFGKFAVVITNVEQFISRIREIEPVFSYGPIEYIDKDNPTGINKYAFLNPILQKDRKRFVHQNEFRLYNKRTAICDDSIQLIPGTKQITPGSHGEAVFNFRSISDIASIYSMDDLFDGIDVTLSIPEWEKIGVNDLTKNFWWNGKENINIDFSKVTDLNL